MCGKGTVAAGASSGRDIWKGGWEVARLCAGNATFATLLFATLLAWVCSRAGIEWEVASFEVADVELVDASSGDSETLSGGD